MDLTELIAAVETEGDGPLLRIAVAVDKSRELSRLGDHLVVHFVDEARAAGHSWAEIGEQLGVSKQAAQQRFVTRADLQFDRWTDRARQVLEGAQQEAAAMQHSWLGTEHILLGLFRVPGSVALQALGALAVTEQAVRDAVVAIIGPGPDPAKGPASFTPRAKRVLEMSLGKALELGHNYVGTEHIVLALVARDTGVAAQVLADLGVEEGRLRAEIVRILSGFAAS
jgi:hypothetical protein